MSTSAPPKRRRFTVVEVLVVAALAALLLAIVVPVAFAKDTNPAQVAAIESVQEGVRKYYARFKSYPTFGPISGPAQSAASPWTAGQAPAADSVPKYAGIDFSASAVVEGQAERVRFSAEMLESLPRHAGEVAADGTQRWRIDHNGTVSVEMDGRSF